MYKKRSTLWYLSIRNNCITSCCYNNMIISSVTWYYITEFTVYREIFASILFSDTFVPIATGQILNWVNFSFVMFLIETKPFGVNLRLVKIVWRFNREKLIWGLNNSVYNITIFYMWITVFWRLLLIIPLCVLDVMDWLQNQPK